MERIGKIRGKLRKRVWVRVGSIVLIQKRDALGDKKKCDVVYVYYVDEIRKLKNYGELPKDLNINEKEL